MKEKELAMVKAKKVVKNVQHQPATPVTKSCTRENTKKIKEVEKPRGKTAISPIEESQPEKKNKLRRKYVAPTKSDGERKELDDISQFQVVSHNPSSDIDNLCENVNNKADLSGFAHVVFDKLGKIDQNKVEDAIYEMMDTFKTPPIDISSSLLKSVYDRVELKWQYSLTTERQIRETTLARVIHALDKEKMKKEMNKFKGIFSPKYRAFNILQNKFEEVIKQSTQIWKVIYELTIEKPCDQVPEEVGDKKYEQGQEVQVKDGHVGGTKTTIAIEVTTNDEQQDDQNVPEIQVPRVIPSHVDQVSH